MTLLDYYKTVDIFGLTEGSLRVRTRGWGLFHVVIILGLNSSTVNFKSLDNNMLITIIFLQIIGIFGITVAFLQIVLCKASLILTEQPKITYNITNVSPSGCISFIPYLTPPKFEVVRDGK